MELSKRDELKNLYDIQTGNIAVTPTRAIVVSNRDPLFLGRVKVWIPTIHGLTINKSETDSSDMKEPPLPEGGFDPGDIFSNNSNSEKVRDFVLPWAKCLGHNWGPREQSSEKGLISGLYSVPKEGTEVFVIFEDNDFNHPIIIGSIIHAGEFTYKPNRPLELSPGILIDAVESLNKEQDYKERSATSYSIRAENGSTLFISDDKKSSCLLLSGIIKPDDVDESDLASYTTYSKNYPGFPTTASAPYTVRTAIGTDVVLRRSEASISSQISEGEADVNQESGVADLSNIDNITVSNIKMWPVKPAVGMETPPLSGAGGRFGAPRDGRRHLGLDIAVAAGAELVAPCDMFAVKFGFDSNAGLLLYCVAIGDNTGHGFYHLEEIDESIKSMIKSGSSTILRAGTKLGITGKSGKYGGIYGHLHWEIYKPLDTPVSTVAAFNTMKAKAKAAQLDGCIDPLKWMKMEVNPKKAEALASDFARPPVTTEYPMTDEQAASYISHLKHFQGVVDQAEICKPIGLEIITVPGQETIMLRHPSGSYMGFDVDGNFVVFTCGDANIKVNRSWNLDVLGGILEVCHAKFTRVRTVLKTWANIFKQVRDKATADSDYPTFFRRAELMREIDINDSARVGLSNAYFVSNTGSLEEAVEVGEALGNTDKYTTPAITTPKNFSDTTYDNLLQEAYNTYIKPKSQLVEAFPNWKYFKAQMLHESNGVKTAFNNLEAYGLMQLRSMAVEDVFGSPRNMQDFFDPKLNIDTGVRYMVKCYNYIATHINRRDKKLGLITKVTPENLRFMSLLCYNTGPTAVGDAIGSETLTEDEITYAAIEARYKVAHPTGRYAIQYVPTIEWIYTKLP